MLLLCIHGENWWKITSTKICAIFRTWKFSCMFCKQSKILANDYIPIKSAFLQNIGILSTYCIQFKIDECKHSSKSPHNAVHGNWTRQELYSERSLRMITLKNLCHVWSLWALNIDLCSSLNGFQPPLPGLPSLRLCPHRFSVLSVPQRASIQHNPYHSHVNDIPWRAKSCIVQIFF